MAHSCPDCSYTCHCGGDIDDLCCDDSPEAMRCTHCFEKDEVEDDEITIYEEPRESVKT